MAPISQVACTLITQIYLKRLKHASSTFIDVTCRSRSNCNKFITAAKLQDKHSDGTTEKQ